MCNVFNKLFDTLGMAKKSSSHSFNDDNDSVFTSFDANHTDDKVEYRGYNKCRQLVHYPLNSQSSVTSATATQKSVSLSCNVRTYILESSEKEKKLANQNNNNTNSNSNNEDTQSIGGCESIIGNVEEDESVNQLGENRIKFLSVMYAMFLVTFGCVITITGIDNPINQHDHFFEIVVTSIGLVWMAFIHWDIQRYKKWTIQYLKPSQSDPEKKASKESVASGYDVLSITTAVICNTFNKPIDENKVVNEKYKLSSYRFGHGKHSGNFYLKCGMIIFCMGSIIHQGVIIAKQIYFFSSGNFRCFYAVRFGFFVMRSLSCFYQLYIVFKYSNILINHYKGFARFALMHLVGTSISFWFSTIVEETTEDYVLKIEALNGTYNYSVIAEEALFKSVVSHHIYCAETALINTDSMEALPYLYPFSIEYNIILASVWFKIWSNIGKDTLLSNSHHIRREISENANGVMEINYKSAMSINADCHASNMGLFIGLSTLLMIFSTMVIFFATIKQNEFSHIGVGIYSTQVGILITLCVFTLPLAYRKIRQLDIVSEQCNNSSVTMDDFLVLIPLPFFIIFYVLSIKAEVQVASPNSILLVIIRVLSIIHISIQTPFIVDASRRCANNKRLRFTKPGRGLVMFLLLLNVTLWILYTFERKSVDKYHNMQNFYGKFIWMVITHTTVPLMLFYYFHSSVCLSDIWKHAYEKDECIT